MSDLLPLVALLALAVGVYVARERRRQRTEVRPPCPDLEIRQLAADAELEEIERRAQASSYPRQAIRQAILDNASLELHLEAIAALPENECALLLKGYEPGMGDRLEATARRHHAVWTALREYARLKYDDAVENDWFDLFRYEAGAYIREKVRLARDYLLAVDPAAGRFAEIYDALLDELRQASLAAPPKRRFPPPDLGR